ncbi:MAG: T9SS type A sorting domain-containing protein, partial [Wenyingzhuangia sp.]
MSVDLAEFVINETEVSVYPNPASSMVNIEILSQNKKEMVTITLYDAIGKSVYTTTVNSENNKVQLDINELESGIYTVSVSNEFFKTNKRLVITK